MDKDSLLLQIVAEQVEKQKLAQAERQKQYINWLGPGNHIFIEQWFSPYQTKKSQLEHETILAKYTSVKTNPR